MPRTISPTVLTRHTATKTAFRLPPEVILGGFSFQGRAFTRSRPISEVSRFYVTANEVCCSDDIPNQYHLFRVFNMRREPQIYILHGSLKILCQLEPILFRAVI